MARVLLVEDDEVQLELRQRILEMAGHQVVTASSREETEPHCLHCDVIVADLIPGAAEFLSGVPAEIKVIVLTGRVDCPESVRAHRILRKPCPTKDLLSAIEQLS